MFPSKDRKTFPAWEMEEQATAMTSCCNIMMQGQQQTVGPTTSETSAMACVQQQHAQ
jgi:hypothetical protein